MNSIGETFYLKASPETIVRHLAISKGERPLLKGKSHEELYNYISQQIAEREQFYLKAKHIIDVNTLDAEEKVDSVVRKIIDYTT